MSFRDNYLAVPFDLSAVMFIATANVLDSIPPPLRDRMELIQLPGYTEEEKALIARRYLVGRQLAASGLDEARCSISDEAIAAIIRDYTREAGVRNLEREIGKVFRHVAMRVAEGEQGSITITPAELPAILGSARFENEVAMRASLPGWPPGWHGHRRGDILFIEASITSGNGRLILTGQLGDVMKESAQAALTLAKGAPSGSGWQPICSKSGTSMCTCRPARSPGWSQRRRGDVHRARLAAYQPPGACRPGDDR